MIFVCGIHGVGKTEYCQELAKKLGILSFTAGQLIYKGKKDPSKSKRVNNINENQRILVEQVKKLKVERDRFILDGHMCLMNQKGTIESVREEVFSLLEIEEIEVLVDNPKNICERLRKRDGVVWEEDLIEKFQIQEIQHAKKIAKSLDVEVKIVRVLDKNRKEKCVFGKNIILPIKPVFIEKILTGEKTYEYRKQLCIDNIDKIYLYATTPVKAILGEVDVLAKITAHKEKLWNMTKDYSGISKEYYDEYFCKSERASAYYLGEAKRYKKPIRLNEVGIDFVPQSYVYVEDL